MSRWVDFDLIKTVILTPETTITNSFHDKNHIFMFLWQMTYTLSLLLTIERYRKGSIEIDAERDRKRIMKITLLFFYISKKITPEYHT